ncbi:bacteriohemerythrin [Teredinibacter franksiae]|jgi:hemerythrin-like metal-binding domain|uniref:bacteriohemerythrin n=1 Tax=Teredinibacter franksiae TaxID=2761453 RepID=UPI001624679D|nr:bacteriohemerythrin [Teredinibacter franksiae]
MITWSEKYEIGIPVIDGQHKRIVEYINLLKTLDDSDKSNQQISEILNLLVDYTLSHFEFEEELMEEADYPAIEAHKKSHLLFKKELDHLQQLFNNGEDIAKLLSEMLLNWLLEHIKEDDSSYADCVKHNILERPPQVHQNWVKNATERYFKRW